jgi:hypothetical protein
MVVSPEMKKTVQDIEEIKRYYFMSARGYPEYCHDNKNPFKTTCAYRINEIRGDNENIIKLIKNEIFTVEMVFFDGIIRYEGQIIDGGYTIQVKIEQKNGMSKYLIEQRNQ